MGILSRFGDIMRANINDLLTGAENKNAEKLLNQYLRDAREDNTQVKNETSSVMAEETAACLLYTSGTFWRGVGIWKATTSSRRCPRTI